MKATAESARAEETEEKMGAELISSSVWTTIDGARALRAVALHKVKWG